MIFFNTRKNKHYSITKVIALYLLIIFIGLINSVTALAARDWDILEPTEPAIDIVVIGDSYSAGNGAGSYEGPGDCFRSPNNWTSQYAQWLHDQGYQVNYSNYACSDAEITYDLGKHDADLKNIMSQVNNIKPETDLVLMTAGGNDLGFVNIIKKCFIENTDNFTACVKNMGTAKNKMQHINNNLYQLFTKIRVKTNYRAKIAFLGYPYLAVNDKFYIPGSLSGINPQEVDMNANFFSADDDTAMRGGLVLENVIASGERVRYHISAETRAQGLILDDKQSQAVFKANSDSPKNYVTFVNLKGLFETHEPDPAEDNPERWMYDTNLRGWPLEGFQEDMYHFNSKGHAAIASHLAVHYGTFGADNPVQAPTEAEILEQMKLDALDAYYAAQAEKNYLEKELQSRLDHIKEVKERVKNGSIIYDWVSNVDETELTTDLLRKAIEKAKSVSNSHISEVEKAGRDLADAYAERARAKQAKADAYSAYLSAKNAKDQKLAAKNNALDNYNRLDKIADEAEEYAAYLGSLPVNDPNFTKQLQAAKDEAKAARAAANYADYAYGQAKISYTSAYNVYTDKLAKYNAAATALNKANTAVSNYEINLTLAQNGYAFSEIDLVIELLEEELAKQLDTTGGMIAYYQAAAGYKEATLEEKIQAELDLIESRGIEKELSAQKDNASIDVYLAYHEVQRINTLIADANIPDITPTVISDPPPELENHPEPEYTVDPDNGLPNFDGPSIVAGAKGVVTNKVKYVAGGARTANMSILKSEGTDDSGLAYYAYKQSGITLENNDHHNPTGTNGIIHLFNVTNEESEATPGDLIFYGYKQGDKPSSKGSWVHDWTNPNTGVEYDVEAVGVYIGNGKLIDTQSSTTGPAERSINFSWAERLGFFQIKSNHANDPVREAAKAEEEAALAAAIAAANESAIIASSMSADAAQYAQSATVAAERVNAIVLVTDAALPFVNQVKIAELDAHQAADHAEAAAIEASLAAGLASNATTSGIAIAAANSAKDSKTGATQAASNAKLAKTIAEGLADEAENINELARKEVIANIAEEAQVILQLANEAAQAASTDAIAARVAADAASARAAVIAAGEGDNAATANSLAASAQQAANNAEAAKLPANTAASEAANIAASIASMATIAEAQQALDAVNGKLTITQQSAETAAAAKLEAENALSQNNSFKTYRILSIGSSGTWWGSAHWRRLGQAIGLSISSSNFGRSPAFERYGAYNSRAKVFQQYLNAKDGGKTSNITADGYWGPQSTEKLRAVLDYRCGTNLKIYGSVDGKGANGTIFTFNQDEAAAFAGCLNQNKF